VSKYPQQSPPRWVIGTGQLGRLTVPAGPITRRGGRHDIIWLRVYDPIFVVSVREWVLLGIAISNSVDGGDDFGGGGICLDLFPQLCNVLVKGTGGSQVVYSPYFI